MFVRWTIKKSRVSTVYSGYRAEQKTAMNARRGDLLVAQLVESKRIDGKPRQKVVAYLGSIRLHDIKRARARLTFWRHAQAAFRKAELTNEQKHQVDTMLQTRVEKPSAEQIAVIDYLKENQSYVDQIPEHESYSDKRIYDVIKQYKQEQGINERKEKEFAGMLDNWVSMFPMALRGTSGKEREELLTMFKDLTGEEYKV
jgi:hypothetical protein